jgi:hypothetical protein
MTEKRRKSRRGSQLASSTLLTSHDTVPLKSRFSCLGMTGKRRRRGSRHVSSTLSISSDSVLLKEHLPV